jgi:hypothetical protein
MKTLLRLCLLGYASTIGFAQTPAALTTLADSPEGAAQIVKVMTEAAAFRREMAASVITGKETPRDAVARLREENRPSGLKIDGDADIALSAIDIGQRLIAAGKPAEAEIFFRDAEKSLDLAMAKSRDGANEDKALFLKKLSLIRGNYLGKVTQAVADLDQAIALQPEDKDLVRSKEALVSARADYLSPKATNEEAKK